MCVLCYRAAAFLLKYILAQYYIDYIREEPINSFNTLQQIQKVIEFSQYDEDKIVSYHMQAAQSIVQDVLLTGFELLQVEPRWDILDENPKIRILN
jgi:hypothetical protein